MGFPRPVFRAIVATVSTVVLTASGLALVDSASADPANPTPVSSTALPTAQVNGVVWTQAISNGVDFVGGSFSESRPAGAPSGTDATPRQNLFAFDITTGQAVDFHATANAQVRGIAASSDGSRIYVVGDFTQVDGQPRSHIAVLDRNGNVLPDFAPGANASVFAVAVRGSTIYVAGMFTAVSGQTRHRVAAFTASGSLLPFAPDVSDYFVKALSVSPDGRSVLLGGNFSQVNSQSRTGLAEVDAVTGASRDWAATGIIIDWGTNGSIYSLSTRGTVVYATGYSYSQQGGTGVGNFEGAVAMNWSDGSIKWLEDCHGDSYSSYPFNDALYVASHAHNCANVVGGWSSPGAPTQWRRAQAFSQSAVGVLAHNTDDYQDFGGRPSPELVPNWSPDINTGTYTGMSQGAWSVTGGGSFVVFGGEFTAVNGQPQAGLVRFQGQPESPDPGMGVPTSPTPTPATGPTQPAKPSATKPNQVSKPSTVSLGPSEVAVRWSAPKGSSTSTVTGYTVRAYKGSKLFKTVNTRSSKRLAVISGLRRSTTYRITVTARNAQGAGRASSSATVRTRSGGRNVSATKTPSKVRTPTTRTSRTTTRLWWSAASTPGALGVGAYQVRITLHGRTVQVLTVSSRSRTHLFVHLKGRTLYQVTVRAHSWAGWGSWSATRSARTR